MEKVIEDKLYRVVRKQGHHISTKINPDGSKAAIQFADDGNALNGPVDIIEVNDYELARTELTLDRSESRTFAEIIWQDVIAPVTRDVLYQALMEGYSSLSKHIQLKAVPKLKAKASKLKKDVGVVASGIKAGLAGEQPKAIQLQKNLTEVCSGNELMSIDKSNAEKVLRSEEEIVDIIRAMETSAITLAACIRLLNDSVVCDDGQNQERRLELQRNIEALSKKEVMQHIDLLLEDKNKALLDNATIQIISAFKDGYFLVNNARVPVAKYLE